MKRSGGFLDEVFEGIDDGYREQEKKREKDGAPLTDKLVEGATEGVADLVHPLKWLRSIFFG